MMAFADIIIIAAVAVFIILRYRSVLGQKTGYDVTKPTERENAQAHERVIQLPNKQRRPVETNEGEEPAEEIPLTGMEEYSATVARIKTLAPEFRLSEFLEGSKAAFEMVIDAFNKDDRETLKMLMSKDIYKEFEEELKHYKEQESRPHTTLVSMESAMIDGMSLTKNTAVITVKYLTEQINVEKDAEGKVVKGDPSQVVQVEDVWEFEKDMRSRDPNWKIINT